MKRLVVLALVLTLPMAALASSESNGPNPGCGEEHWETVGGTLVFVPNAQVLQDLGLRIHDVQQTDVVDEIASMASTFAAIDTPGLKIVAYDGIFRAFAGGQLQTLGGLTLVNDAKGSAAAIGDWKIERVQHELAGARWLARDTANDSGVAFRLVPNGQVRLNRDALELQWNGVEVYVHGDVANKLGIDADAAFAIGHLFFRAPIVASDNPNALTYEDPTPQTTRGGGEPDVITGDLYDPTRNATVGSQTAWSFGTESCNIGTKEAEWFANTNRHPVIGATVFRVKDGRFEQIGMNWLKHSFCAIDLTLCDPCVDLFGCDFLSVGCSDPYSAFLNGQQSDLGPRYQVNPLNGVFPYPPANPSYSGSLARRLIVQNSDIDPAQNAGAHYFVEGTYVTQDDAQAGNGYNNASYRRVRVTGSLSPAWVAGQNTVRELPAIYGWTDVEPNATVVEVDDQAGGRFHVGMNIVDNGNGTWTYNYAIYNLNSHDACRSFEVPVPSTVSVSSDYFSDLDYHSGELQIGTDWTYERLSNSVKWSTVSESQNPNGNAIHWGTAYSFGFTCDAPPREGRVATCEQFRNSNTFSPRVSAPDAPALPFLTLGLTSNDPVVSAGEILFADATLDTDPGMGQTTIDYLLTAEMPNGQPYAGNPILARTKSTPAGISKQREVRFRLPNDAMAGTWKLILSADAVGDARTESVEMNFTVN